MDRAVLTTLLVLSVATNLVVLGLFLVGRVRLVRQRASLALPTTRSTPAPLVGVMAQPADQAMTAAAAPPGEEPATTEAMPSTESGEDSRRRAWTESAEALASEASRIGQPTTVVLFEIVSPPSAESPIRGSANPLEDDSPPSWLPATVRAADVVLDESPTTFRVVLANTDESEAGAFVDRCKVAFERANTTTELIAAWARLSDAGLDVAIRLAEARLAGRREGWIRSVAVR